MKTIDPKLSEYLYIDKKTGKLTVPDDAPKDIKRMLESLLNNTDDRLIIED